jgi:hypothetical protein
MSFKNFIIENKNKKASKFFWNTGDLKASINEEAPFHRIKSEPFHVSRHEIDYNDARLNDQAEEHKKLHDSNHKDSINHYSDYGHEDINRYHRHGGDSEHFLNHEHVVRGAGSYERIEQVDEHTKNLDHVTSHKTEHDMHVYRGFGNMHIKGMKEGSIYHDKGYTSTTINPEIAKRFNNNRHHPNNYTVAKIHVPKGTKGYYIGHHDYGQAGEKEFLLHRGTHFKITGHSHDPEKNIHVVHMTVHKQDEH